MLLGIISVKYKIECFHVMQYNILLYNMKLPSIPLIFSTEWRLNQTVQYFYKTVQ